MRRRYESLRTLAKHLILRAIVTDVIFLYSPSQIALSAIYHAAKDAKMPGAVSRDVDLYLHLTQNV